MTARDEAKARFTRGKQLVEEKDLPAALVEFQRAFALVPSPITQLNIAFVYVQMRRPVEAVDALEAALKSRDLPAAYADTARATLADQHARIGSIDVTTSLPATLELDGVEIGRTPLAEPLRVGEGLHTLAAVAAGCPPVRREVRAVGGGVERVSIVLTPAVGMGSLTITANVSDAEASVDGAPVGRTPFSASLPVPAGTHEILLRRLGYRETRRSIEIKAGSAGAVAVNLDEDANAPASARGALVLASSEPAVTLSIDGRSQGAYRGERLDLPLGRHHLVVEHAGFVTAEKEVVVSGGGVTQVRVALTPTSETYLAYTRAVGRQRSWGWAAAAGGAAVALAAGGFAWHYTNAVHDAESAIDDFQKRYDPSSAACDATHPELTGGCRAAQQDRYDHLNIAEDRRRLALGGVGLGAVALGIGAYLLLSADDPHRYDGAAVGLSSERSVASMPLVWLDSHGGGVLMQTRF